MQEEVDTGHVTVSGKWPFPTNMLAFNNARPASDRDAALIELLSGPCADLEVRKTVMTIQLVMTGTPSYAQWRGCGWHVLGDQAYDQQKEEEALAALRKSGLRKLTLAERKALGI